MLLQYKKALLCYKKELRLAWYMKDIRNELEIYDKIGIVYYYLGDIQRASYYNGRMMGRKLEGDTPEKILNTLNIRMNIKEHTEKKSIIRYSIFEQDKLGLKEGKKMLPHENYQYTIPYSKYRNRCTIKKAKTINIQKI